MHKLSTASFPKVSLPKMFVSTQRSVPAEDMNSNTTKEKTPLRRKMTTALTTLVSGTGNEQNSSSPRRHSSANTNTTTTTTTDTIRTAQQQQGYDTVTKAQRHGEVGYTTPKPYYQHPKQQHGAVMDSNNQQQAAVGSSKTSSGRRQSTMPGSGGGAPNTAEELEQRSRRKQMVYYVKRTGEKHLRKMHVPRREPIWIKLLKRLYHEYGGKHFVLGLILILYAVIGAFFFYLIEMPAQTAAKDRWTNGTLTNRTRFIDGLIGELYNNSRFLVYITNRTGERIKTHLNTSMRHYETQLGIKYTDQKIEWDYYNAILYCGTLATTIGYGHIYPRTIAGQILTIIYALGGIPLVLLILQDWGKILTMALKFPWWQFKRGFRRCIRWMTKQSWDEMLAIEKKEREELKVFDLPIPVAIGLIVGWVFLCSAVFCTWDSSWNYVQAFYFFFISLSTVGLGDLTPGNPRLLLAMFLLIIVGLSLVSMVVNLIQMKLENTYEKGREETMNESEGTTTVSNS